jgi:hypothetical protein
MFLIWCHFVSFRYNSVLNSCCLRPDLAILPNSDLTEVHTFCPWWDQGSRKQWGVPEPLLGVHPKCLRKEPLGEFSFFGPLCYKNICSLTWGC